MLLGEQYKLIFRWDKVYYVGNNVCTFENAYFTGPVLKQAEKINEGEFIRLDFTKQYYIAVDNYYVLDLHWGIVSYTTDKVMLGQTKFMYNKEWKKAHILNNTDYIVIDTRGHEMEDHYKNLVYYSYVVDKEGQPYNFRRN